MAIALRIHHVYTATEEILLRISRTFGRIRYEGADWHRDLLKDASLVMEGIRPPVISDPLRRSLDEYRGFRHIVRHGYEYELDWRRMAHLVSGLGGVAADLRAALNKFMAFVDHCISNLQDEEAT